MEKQPQELVKRLTDQMIEALQIPIKIMIKML